MPLQDDGGAAVHEMTLAGAFTALPGGLVGAVIGYYAGRSADDREWGGLDEVGAGALFGLALGAPVGVHVVNGRRGSIGLELGAAAAVGGIAWALAEGSAPPAVSIGTSVLGSSLVAALIERHTGS